MTDETAPSGKLLWTRHPGCGWRVFNDPIDIAHHERLCPQLLMRKIKNMETALEKITKADPVVAPELPDLDSVAPWSGEDDATEDDQAEDVSEVSSYDQAIAPILPVSDGWDDDEESLASVPIVR